MGIFSNAFGAGNACEADIDNSAILPRSHTARHYKEQAAAAGDGNGKSDEPRDGKII